MGVNDVINVFFILTLSLRVQCQAVADMRAAMLIIDIQTCFLPAGSLAIEQADIIIPIINDLRKDSGKLFKLVVLSQDWHCPKHVSFASSHPGKKPFETAPLRYFSNGTLCYDNTNQTKVPGVLTCPAADETRHLEQMLWPDHCVEDVTSGPTSSNISKELTVTASDVIIKKGTHCQIDSYSAFYDNGRFSATELDAILKSNGIDTVFVMGLALDFCVKYTALDAKQLGYKTYTVVDASMAVAKDTEKKALGEMDAAGVELITSHKVWDILTGKGKSNTAVRLTLEGTHLLTLTSHVLLLRFYL
ncbi:unnamed protein product [Lymnaea stagnalis]|uniref:nicotinamidase n=1 Tax=Lymnaea stagnalis TaxID=6523 RepID=A0AAV2H3J0_LYMST